MCIIKINIVYMYIPDWKWHAYKEGIHVCMVYRDLVVSLALQCT